ncbi:TRAP transporter large permease [Desulfatitalea tepidiphila]|uniref:TRAP transporter large permease n=1 Tax=Desulfatitalea tepidiphila TaxID=1185843 RepID=UPI0006B4C8F7|nr:TRAP transporter large permease subunit [Desulfatitalea tepidiphila]
MDWVGSLSGAVVIMLGLFFIGLPVFLTFLVINIIGVFMLMGTSGFGMFANSIYQSVTQTSLAAVPLFIIMGEILFRSGTIDILIDSVDKLVGSVKGRGYYLITVLSTLFGALCGSPVAVAALLGRTVMPGMTGRGYNVRFTAGAILGGATLAAIIPPSLLVVVLGSLVDVSKPGLLIAGIVPGMLLAGLMAGFIFLSMRIHPELEPVAAGTNLQEVTGRGQLMAVIRIVPFSLVIFFVMGWIMLGVATPSESAATGVVGAVIVAPIYRKLSLKMLMESVLSTVAITAMLMAILLSSQLFDQLLAFTGATSGLMKAVSGLSLSSGAMFLLLMAGPFFLCMFIDLFAIMLVAIPIYLPLIKIYGYEPTWFWMLFVINLVLGSMTPPFGYTLFSLKGAAPAVSLEDIYVGAWPMMFVFLVGMAIMFFFPSLVSFLPGVFN